jgi:UDP-GlcNAc:undecaprenyl-phosphate GlcNAc-1-phosphate transferase
VLGGGIDGLVSGELTDLLAVTACGAVVTLAEAVTIPLLRRAAIIDIPGQRSSHTIPTPRGGGIPIAAGLLVAAGLIGGTAAMVFAFAVVSFGLLGFAEDVRGLPVGYRLITQLVGGAVVAVVLTWGRAEPGVVHVLVVALCALWITGFVNAFNFMDGVNGISGAHALIAGVVYACLGSRSTSGSWFRPVRPSPPVHSPSCRGTPATPGCSWAT